MMGMKRSRVSGLVGSSKDVKRCGNVNRNSGRDLMTVGLGYIRKASVHRDVSVIEDSREELQHNDLVDTDYFDFLMSDLMSFKESQDKKAVSIDGTKYDPQCEMFLSCLKPYGTSCILEVSETNGLSEPIIYGLGESDELLESGNRVLRSHDKCVIPSKDCLVNSDGSETKRLLKTNADYAGFLSSNLIGQHGVCFSKPELSDDVILIEDEDDDSPVNFHGEISSDFRKELIKVLRQPYNDAELKELYDKISARKTVDRHMDLRNGRDAFLTGEKLGKSYLDRDYVLRMKLEMAEDSYEKLNLLRGFFFWLEKAPRDGAFKPWEDAECLAVLPQAVLGKRKQQM